MQPHREIPRRINDLNNDIALTLGRMDEALDMLEVWSSEHPDDVGMVRMSHSLLKRCGREPKETS